MGGKKLLLMKDKEVGVVIVGDKRRRSDESVNAGGEVGVGRVYR